MMKEVKLKLIAELLKNSHRSDRELAKAIGASQPTVSRLRSKLEKEGIIKEYTIIPDFSKLGFEMLAMTFVKLNHLLSNEEIEQAHKLIKDTSKTMPIEVVMLERGMGMDSDGVIISYHTDYAANMKFLELLKGTGFLDVKKLDIFRVNLKDDVRFVPLSFSLLAQYISAMKESAKP